MRGPRNPPEFSWTFENFLASAVLVFAFLELVGFASLGFLAHVHIELFLFAALGLLASMFALLALARSKFLQHRALIVRIIGSILVRIGKKGFLWGTAKLGSWSLQCWGCY